MDGESTAATRRGSSITTRRPREAFAEMERYTLAALRAQFEVLPDAGHMVHFDAPEALGALALQFLRRHR